MQKLKESMRQSILDAAIEEFSENGYKNASLRKIAQRSNITVGNIYCYYKNKEELYHAVIHPVLEEIEEAILNSTNQQVDWNFDEKSFLKKDTKLEIDFKSFSNKLIEIKKKYSKQMEIIMQEDKYRGIFKKWLASVLYVYFVQKNSKQSPLYIKIISNIASVTLIDAVIEVFQYHKECSDLNMDESDIVYSCFKAVMQTEESKL